MAKHQRHERARATGRGHLDEFVTSLESHVDPGGNNSALNGVPMASTAAAFLVMRRGSVIAEHYLGTHGPRGGEAPVGPESRFGLWSATKQWFTLGLLRLVHEGYVESLDEPVARYLPEFRGLGGGRAYEAGSHERGNVTIRQLFSQTSGVRVDPHAPGAGRHLWMYAPVEQPPGSAFSYNDYNKSMECELIARAWGPDVHAAIAELVFEPLGLDDTGFYLPGEPGWYRGGGQLERAVPLYGEPAGWAPNRAARAEPIGLDLARSQPAAVRTCWPDTKSPDFCGIFYSTLRDVARFGEAWLRTLRGEAVGGVRYASRELAAEAVRPQPTNKRSLASEDEPSTGMPGWTMGLRWWIRVRDGLLMSAGLSQCRLYLHPPSDTVGVVLRNANGIPANFGLNDHDHLDNLIVAIAGGSADSQLGLSG